ncbi:cytidine deaminase [Acuticoccus sp.]|uniref:cytidine deaminase n=1 Tax=Acuticoccus sp. TaxID=1904378 RepID=UPI003B518514
MRRPSEAEAALLERARAAADTAYAPYSGFHVGAAVSDGTVTFAAANVENASYGLSACAEMNAVVAAALAGARALTTLAVVGYRPDRPDVAALATPCGRCRQVFSEFAAPDSRVLVRDHLGLRDPRRPSARAATARLRSPEVPGLGHRAAATWRACHPACPMRSTTEPDGGGGRYLGIGGLAGATRGLP